MHPDAEKQAAGAKEWQTVLASLAGSTGKDAKFFAKQLETAARVFGVGK
jgi:hypothetical protein